jgi:hypothetical protein
MWDGIAGNILLDHDFICNSCKTRKADQLIDMHT